MLISAKLELGVGDDDAALPRVGSCLTVHAQTDRAYPLSQIVAEDLLCLGEIDVLIVLAGWRLGRRREDGFRQLRCDSQPSWQRNSAYLTATLVVLPARAVEVAAYDRLYRQGLQLPRDDGPSCYFPAFVRVG